MFEPIFLQLSIFVVDIFTIHVEVAGPKLDPDLSGSGTVGNVFWILKQHAAWRNGAGARYWSPRTSQWRQCPAGSSPARRSPGYLYSLNPRAVQDRRLYSLTRPGPRRRRWNDGRTPSTRRPSPVGRRAGLPSWSDPDVWNVKIQGYGKKCTKG